MVRELATSDQCHWYSSFVNVMFHCTMDEYLNSDTDLMARLLRRTNA